MTPTPFNVTVEIAVPVKINAKVLVEAGGQVHVLDAYIVNDVGGTLIRNLGDPGYIQALDAIAAAAREADREDFDARR